MPSSVAQVKTGLCDYLASWEGLRPADGVSVRSAAITPDEATRAQVILGDVTAPQDRAGLARKEERPVMTCWIETSAAGGDETAIRAARDQADTLLAAIDAALTADPAAGGTIPAPANATLGESALTEFPIEFDGSAARRAQYRFTITWVSHL